MNREQTKMLFDKLTPINACAKYGICPETNKVFSLQKGGMSLREVKATKPKHVWRNGRDTTEFEQDLSVRFFQLRNDAGKRVWCKI